MCNWLVDDAYVKDYNANFVNSSDANAAKVEKQYLLDECNSLANRLLQLGLQQTINTIVQSVLQGSLQFRDPN